MNKQALLGQYAYFKAVHGVTLRLIGSFSDADLDYAPKAGMRSVRDLILHIYGGLKTLPADVRAGKLTVEPETAALKTVADCQAFARACFQATEEGLASLSDEQLAADVEAPYGAFPGWKFFSFVYDEHWHHRGQLYTYARLLGKEPPMLYDYENSPA